MGLGRWGFQENRPKGPKHEQRKSETQQQKAFPKKPCQNHGGRTCRKAAHHNKHKPTHPPRLIIQSVLCENRNGKKRGTNTGQSNHTPCEVCIFKGNQRQLGAHTSKNIENQMDLGHTQAKTFKNKWNFAFKYAFLKNHKDFMQFKQNWSTYMIFQKNKNSNCRISKNVFFEKGTL